MATRTFGEICAGVAAVAKASNRKDLSYLLEMVALEFQRHGGAINAELTERYDLLLKPPTFGIWDWDITNDVRYLDPTCAAFFGFKTAKRTGFVRDELFSKIHPDDFAGWKKKVSDAAKNGGAYEHEYRIIYNDEPMWVHSRGHCFLDKTGRPERFPGALLNINSLKTGPRGNPYLYDS